MTNLEISQIQLLWIIIAGVVGWILFIINAIIPYFFTSKDKRDSLKIENRKLNLELQKRADEKIRELGEAHREFIAESARFYELNAAGVNDFSSMTAKANNYFDKLLEISSAIIDKNLSDTSIRYILSDRINEAVENQLIEDYYSILKEKFPVYTGTFKEENYRAIFVLYYSYLSLKKHWWNRFISFLISNLYKLYIKKIKDPQDNTEIEVVLN